MQLDVADDGDLLREQMFVTRAGFSPTARDGDGSEVQTYKVKARPQPDVRPHMRLCQREASGEVSKINSARFVHPQLQHNASS